MSSVDQIKERLDLVGIVSEYVALGKSGRNFKARCPFHNERTPSFYVFPDTQTWRCFGACATGGDMFSFVMRQQGMQFGETLRLLAQKAGVALEEVVRNPEEEERTNRLIEANQAAALFYHHQLLNAPEAASVRAYVEQRGINKETAEAFLLGYSPQRRETLKAHLVSRGFSEAELEAAGLLFDNDGSKVDRFWNRLMFPIWNASGALVGFGARTLTDAQPKYLNTQQTPIFDKSGILYALHKAQDSLRREKQAVIVEGYMDALMAHQYGFRNVVASMGTSLTETQVQLLSRYASSLVLALDPDAAGQSATLRSLETAPAAMGEEIVPVPEWRGHVKWGQRDGRPVISRLPQGTINLVARHKGEIRVLELPLGKDPDELIRSDAAQWPRLIEQSVPMMDFLLKSITQRLDLTTPKGKAQAADEVLPFISELPSVVEQGHYLQRLAGLVGADEQTLRSALPDAKKPRRSQSAPAPAVTNMREHFNRTQALEDYCLALLFQHDHLREHTGRLQAGHFLSTEARALFETWQAYPGAVLGDVADEALLPRLVEIGAVALPPSTEAQNIAALTQCMRRLEERRLRDIKLHNQLRASGEPGSSSPLTLVSEAQDGSQEVAQESAIEPEEELRVNKDLQQLMVENNLKRTAIKTAAPLNEQNEPLEQHN